VRMCLIIGCFVLATPAGSLAQVQNQNPLGGGATPYVPNYYNRNNQPLSPYLNLLRGGNPAVNYFYGVRPGLMNGAFGSPFTGGGNNMMGRQTFFPQIDTLYDLENTNPQDGIRPTGHPFGFNNTLGYFGVSPGMMGSAAQRNPNQSPMSSRR